jgi:hypothetical protein
MLSLSLFPSLPSPLPTFSEEHITSILRVKGKQSKKPTETDDNHSLACYLLALVSCLALSSILKMVAIYPSETLLFLEST